MGESELTKEILGLDRKEWVLAEKEQGFDGKEWAAKGNSRAWMGRFGWQGIE